MLIPGSHNSYSAYCNSIASYYSSSPPGTGDFLIDSRVCCIGTGAVSFGTGNSPSLEVGYRSVNVLNGVSYSYLSSGTVSAGSNPWNTTGSGNQNISIRTAGRIICLGEIDVISSRDTKFNI